MEDLRSNIKLIDCVVYVGVDEQYPNEVRGNFQCRIKNDSEHKVVLDFTLNVRGYNEIDVTENTTRQEIDAHGELNVAFGSIRYGSGSSITVFSREKPGIDFIINEVFVIDSINLA